EKLLYTFQMKQATFWEALDKICDASGLQLQHGYGDDQFRLYFQDYHAPYVYRTGPFRLVAEGFSYNRNISFGHLSRTGSMQPQAHESMSFTFHIAAEPKLPLLGLGEVKLTAAYDDQKNSMLLVPGENGEVQFGRRYYRYGGGSRQYMQHANVPITW